MWNLNNPSLMLQRWHAGFSSKASIESDADQLLMWASTNAKVWATGSAADGAMCIQRAVTRCTKSLRVTSACSTSCHSSGESAGDDETYPNTCSLRILCSLMFFNGVHQERKRAANCVPSGASVEVMMEPDQPLSLWPRRCSTHQAGVQTPPKCPCRRRSHRLHD